MKPNRNNELTHILLAGLKNTISMEVNNEEVVCKSILMRVAAGEDGCYVRNKTIHLEGCDGLFLPSYQVEYFAVDEGDTIVFKGKANVSFIGES